jgi:hypothetical protein
MTVITSQTEDLLKAEQVLRETKVAAVLSKGEYIPARLVMDLLLDCFYEPTKGLPVHDQVLEMLTLTTRRMTFKSADVYRLVIAPASGHLNVPT